MTVFGADVSAYQSGLDLRKLKAQGYDFVMLKCTEGHTIKDAAYPTFLQMTADAKLDVLAYHFVRSDSPPVSQAQNLASHIGDKRVPVMVDLEPEGSSAPDLSHLFAFTQACVALGLRVELLYDPLWYWAKLGRPNLPSSYDLISSLYGRNNYAYASQLYSAAGGDKGSGWNAYGGVVPTFWQFGSDDRVDGYSRPIDVDAYRGTLDQLRATGLFHDWSPAPPNPPVPPKPDPPKPAENPVWTSMLPVSKDRLNGWQNDAYPAGALLNATLVYAHDASAAAGANAAKLAEIEQKLDAALAALPTPTTPTENA